MKMRQIYFVGAGGIGMANLVRYFLAKGYRVGGYDRTKTSLTEELTSEGAELTYEDGIENIPIEFKDKESTLVVYTPAVPESNRILYFFRENGFEVIKRAALLGKITSETKGLCVAGSHGKTTTSSMLAHIMHNSEIGCNAFLGGILRNYNSNLILSESSPYSIIEADEYDRSFHHLLPYYAVVTSTDADHLDIYGTEENYLDSFSHFTSLIRPGGVLIVHTGLKFEPRVDTSVEVCTYSGGSDGDYHSENIRYDNGHLYFDFVFPDGRINDIDLGVPIEINIDNAIAAITVAWKLGVGEDVIRESMRTFLGAKRRFEIWQEAPKGEGCVLIDDYAHSPNEVKASIESVKRLYQDRALSVIFQPHLYTRTRDFATDFAAALSAADEVILCEIYPAREEPIEGVSSEIIYKQLRSPKKRLCERKDLVDLIKNSNFEILMTLGASDINVMLPSIKEILSNKR